MAKNNKTILGPLLIIIAGCFWGSMGIFVRRLSTYGFDSIQIVSIRVTLAAILFALVLLIKDRRGFKIALRDLPLFLGLGFGSILFFTVCYFTAITMMPLSTAAILLYTSPIWIMLMSFLFFHEKMNGRKVLALALAFAGCVLVSGISGEGITVKGLLIGLGSGIGYGLYSILGTVALRKYSPYTVTAYTFLFAAAGSWFICRPSDMARKFSDASDLGFLVGFCFLTALVTAVIPFLSYTLGLERMEASKAGIIATIEPLVATLIGIVVFEEPLRFMSGAGMLLILAAVVVLNMKEKGENMRKVILSILLGAVLLFILPRQGGAAEAESGKIKVTADGGYVASSRWYDEDYQTWELGQPIEEADTTDYNPVLFCWAIPVDKRLTGVHVTKTYRDGSTESYDDDIWGFSTACYGMTEDGKMRWGLDVYPHVMKNVKEIVISPKIEDVSREPIIIDLRNGISYYYDENDDPDSFRFLRALFRYCGEWCNILEIKDPSEYTKEPWHVDLDKDGSWDVEVTSEGAFCEPYDGGWWDDQDGIIISLPTRNLSGDYSVTLTLGPEPRMDLHWIYGPWDQLYFKYGFQVPVIFRFGDEPTKELHSVSVEEGYAEKFNPSTGRWERVTSAAPGDELRICRNSFEGEYVSAWKSNYWSLDSISLTEQNAYNYNKLYMPGADVSFSAVKSPQTAYQLDLTQGFYCIGHFEGESFAVRKMIDAGSHAYDPEKHAYDLNGDGTYDISIREWGYNQVDDVPDSYVFVPLPTCNMTGTYTISVLNDGPDWPLVITFPENVSEEYAVSVNGGRAVDADGNTVTKAAPGTLLYVETNFGPEVEWIQYKSDLKGFWDEDSYIYFDGRVYFIMPAHDVVIIPYRLDGDAIITPGPNPIGNTPTPDPGENTPTPDENTPTPDEITPTATITPDGENPTGQLTPTPTASEADGKDEPSNPPKKNQEKQKDSGSPLLYILIAVCVICIIVTVVAYRMSKKPVGGKAMEASRHKTARRR